MDYFKACKTVVAECNNGYAKTYANAGLGMYNEHAQKVQALYILNNIQHWRGETAKAVRAFLKDFSKELR